MNLLERYSPVAAGRTFRALEPALYSMALFTLNWLICRELFHTEYTSHLESIEAAYISISRYILDQGAWGWFPLWYNGIPFQNTYPPLLHWTVALAAWVFSISPALAHHVVCAAIYCMGPVTLLWAAGGIGGLWRLGFAAAITYSLLSPSVLLAPGVRAWAGGVSDGARLSSLVQFGDGPHVAAVALLPVALLAIHAALERWHAIRVYLAATVFAAVVLTNWLGAFSLALLVLSYLAARAERATWHELLLRTGLIAAIAYCLAAPWVTVSVITSVWRNAQYVIGYYPLTALHVIYWLALLGAALAAAQLLRRFGAGLLARIACVFCLLIGSIVLTEAWFGTYLMPQAHRYQLELDMAISLAAVALLWPWASGLAFRYRAGLGALLAVSAVLSAVQARSVAHQAIQPIDMTQTIEYQASTWMREHLPDRRVFISGSTQFWLNAFTDTPQIGGGYGQGVINPTIPIIHFGIPFTEGDGETTAMWLRIYGAAAVMASEADSRDAYKHVWRDASKFHGVLPELWRDGGDVIYAVPGRSTESLAHIVRADELPGRAPINVVDMEPVSRLAAALEDTGRPAAMASWNSRDRMGIEAQLERGDLLYVQVSYHPGWRALIRDEERPVRADALGMIVIDPSCEGACVVELRYDGGWELLIAWLLMGAAILGGVTWVAVRAMRRRSY